MGVRDPILASMLLTNEDLYSLLSYVEVSGKYNKEQHRSEFQKLLSCCCDSYRIHPLGDTSYGIDH